MKINLITLGCSKNLVDSEKVLYQLKKNGHQVYHNSEQYTDGVIINTCGFILDAKKESIETILDLTQAKKRGFVDKVAVMGCLSERYMKSLKEEIPEIDAFFGVNDFGEIISFFGGNYYSEQLHKRINHTPDHYAYLKISEGCNRNCAFCAIPSIRGRQVSVPLEDLQKESKELARKGVQELILIAQELSSYGTDLYGRKALAELISQLVETDSFRWIRLHYLYPDHVPVDDIIHLMKQYSSICRYMDMPVQHISDGMLKAMRRGHTRRDIEYIVERFRNEIPDIAIRTTVITGFPGETEKDFEELKAFISQQEFDRLGVFPYSHEDGTHAFNLKDDVPDELKLARMEEIMDIQQQISVEKNLGKVGSVMEVLVDRKESEFYIARSEFDSPEVDNEVLIPANGRIIKPGEFYKVKIFDALEYDLYGKPI